VRLYQDGKTTEVIGKKYQMSGTNIARILKNNGAVITPYRIKNGGISISDNGYLRFNQTKSNGVNAGRRLHDLIAEMMIGRPLRHDEVVHHIDGDKLNNNLDNLEVMTRAEHTTLHKKGKRCSISAIS
jgi:hypothetical protein